MLFDSFQKWTLAWKTFIFFRLRNFFAPTNAYQVFPRILNCSDSLTISPAIPHVTTVHSNSFYCFLKEALRVSALRVLFHKMLTTACLGFLPPMLQQSAFWLPPGRIPIGQVMRSGFEEYIAFTNWLKSPSPPIRTNSVKSFTRSLETHSWTYVGDSVMNSVYWIWTESNAGLRYFVNSFIDYFFPEIGLMMTATFRHSTTFKYANAFETLWIESLGTVSKIYQKGNLVILVK